jgi:hypothetical protein
MRRRLGLLPVAMLLGSLPLSSAAAVERRADESAQASSVTVVLDQTEIEAGPGEKVRFSSTVRNTGDQPLNDLVAHLAILSSDPDVYVDPEDWSPRRTQYVDGLAPGQDATLSWNVQAVTAGPLILYVAVTDPQSETVVASRPLSMAVTGRRVVDSADALALVAGVPATVLLLLALSGVRRRQRR